MLVMAISFLFCEMRHLKQIFIYLVFHVRISVQYNEENIAVLFKMGYCMEKSCVNIP